MKILNFFEILKFWNFESLKILKKKLKFYEILENFEIGYAILSILTMFFLKREDFSQSSLIEGRGEMTEKRPRVLKKHL
jgi:hypothetical protein